MTGLRLYGVVRAGTRVPTAALDGGALPDGLDLVSHDDLAVVVSPLPDGELTDRDATGHLDVLSALVVDGPVLALRFGTAAPDADAVRDEVLGTAPVDLAARLNALAGLVELRVDISFDEQEILRAVLASDPDVRTLAARQRDGADVRLQLGEAVAEAVAVMRDELGERLMGPVVERAEATRRLDGGRGAGVLDLAGESDAPIALRWALLVRHDAVSQVDQLVADLRGEHPDASVEYVGPLPVLAFLEETTPVPAEPVSRWGW